MKFKVLLFIVALLVLSSAAYADLVVISPDNPTTNNDLTCRVLRSDFQSDFSFVWRINGRSLPSNYAFMTNEGSILLARYTDYEDLVSCEAYNAFGILVGSYSVTVQPVPLPVNQPPVAVAGDDFSTETGISEYFNGGDSYDSDGNIVSYSWTFSDDGFTFQGVNVDHIFNQEGSYQVTLTVTDDDGATASDSLNVNVVRSSRPREHMIRVGNINVFSDNDFSDLSNSFFRSDPAYITFSLRDDLTGRLTTTPISNINVWLESPDGIRTAYLQPFTGNIGFFGLTRIVNGRRCLGISPGCIPGSSTYYYVLNNVPLDDSFLGVSDFVVNVQSAVNEGIHGIAIMNNIPIAVAGEDLTSVVGDSVTFSADGSNDLEDGVNLNYEWNFGDGTPSAVGFSFSHTFSQPGIYTATLTATDSDSSFDVDNVIVNIRSRERPPAGAGIPNVEILSPADHSTFNVGRVIRFTSSISDLEDDLSDLSCAWNFGDDSNLLTGSCDSLISVSHTYQNEGVYTVLLVVTDTDDNTDSDNLVLNIEGSIVGDGLVAVIDVSNANPFVDEIITFSGRRSSGSVNSYEWNFGDGTTANGLFVRHSFSSAGDYNIKLTVKSDNGNSDTESITVSVFDVNLDAYDNDKPNPRFVVDSDFHSFRISPVVGGSVLVSGKTKHVFLKLSNLGDVYEKLNIRIYADGIGDLAVADVTLAPGEINLIPLFIRVPSNVNAGNYIAAINVDNRKGDSIKAYWRFLVQD